MFSTLVNVMFSNAKSAPTTKVSLPLPPSIVPISASIMIVLSPVPPVISKLLVTPLASNEELPESTTFSTASDFIPSTNVSLVCVKFIVSLPPLASRLVTSSYAA